MLPVLSPAIGAGGTRALCLLLSTRETQGRLLSVTLGAQPAGAAVPPHSPPAAITVGKLQHVSSGPQPPRSDRRH